MTTQGTHNFAFRRRFARHRPRRGAVYLVVMSMSMLVGAMGLGALLAARAQVRTGSASVDFAVARLCARAGLEVALYKIRSTPTWRTTLGNGQWFNQVSLGQGAYSVSAADPIAGDVTIDSNHPVVLTCVGTKGAAVYKMQTTVAVTSNGLGAVGYSLCANGKLNLGGTATLTTDQIVVSNNNVNLPKDATINGSVECTGTIGGGGTYNGSTLAISTPILMPDAAHVSDYYVANGTAIPYTALYQSNTTQLVTNGEFETDAGGWYVYSPSAGNTAALSRSTAQHKAGAAALLVSGRASAGDVPATNLPLAAIRSGDTYAVSVPVYAAATGNVSATLALQATGGNVSFSTAAVALKATGAWVTTTGNLTPTWSGTLTGATLTITTTNLASPLYVDSASVKDTTFGPGAYVMDRVVLSPASNPYGTTNAQGIYVIDCGGKAVTIGPCRVVGTIVLKNYGPATSVAGPVAWEAAVGGYPALLTDGDLNVAVDKAVALSESSLGVNFNPAGSPYPYGGGTVNATATDAFASNINGVFYVGGKLTLSSNPAFKGVVISTGDANVNGTGATISFDNAAYVNPPPGFASGVPAIAPVPGSWQRVVGP